MKKLSLFVAVGAVIASPVFANDYQAEIGLTYGQIDYPSADLNTTTLFGEVFFDKVDTSKGPLGEASFLDKSSGLAATYTEVEDADNNDWNLSGRFVLSSDYIVEASAASINDSDTIGLGFGKYLTDTTDLVFSYAKNDDADVDTFALDLHSVVALEGDASLAYTLTAAYLNTAEDSGTSLSGDLTYYVNNNLGLGASYSRESISDLDISSWSVFVDWFVTGNLDLGLVYASADLDFIETDTITGSLSYRF